MIIDFNRLYDIFYFSFFSFKSESFRFMVSMILKSLISFIYMLILFQLRIFLNTIVVVVFSPTYYCKKIISILFQIQLKNAKRISIEISLPKNIQRFLFDGTRRVKTFSKYFDRTQENNLNKASDHHEKLVHTGSQMRYHNTVCVIVIWEPVFLFLYKHCSAALYSLPSNANGIRRARKKESQQL